MLISRTHRSSSGLLLLVACLAMPLAESRASGFGDLTGAIAGVVKDPHGVPQMGAAVTLFNRQEKPVGRVLTDAHGEFLIARLVPALYSIHVSMPTFDPAVMRGVQIRPGMRSLLTVNLSVLFSSIQLAWPPLDNGNMMTEDWKWVLRGAADARPITRFLDPDSPDAQPNGVGAAVYSQTRGIVRLSAGDGAFVGDTADEADLGTAFAVATPLYGNGSLLVSGNLSSGAQAGAPATAFRASYSRELGSSQPIASLTLRQLFLPGRPVVRAVSGDLRDETRVSESLTVDYGFGMDSLSFLGHTNYYSPFMRLRYALDPQTEVEVAFASGNARPQSGPGLNDDADGSDAGGPDLERDLETLGMFPRISELDGSTRVQRGVEYEMAISRRFGSRTARVSAYREYVSDAALAMSDPYGVFSNSSDVLPELFSNNAVFNAGAFSSIGYSVSIAQKLGQYFTATAIYAADGGLTAGSGGQVISSSPDELRSMIFAGRRQSGTARLHARIPKAGTYLIASYQWSGDKRWLLAGNLYGMAERTLPGFNVQVRQPIPGTAGRVEATADLRNLLAQGYLPVLTPGGQEVLLVDNPRSIRGGLAITF